MSKNLTRKGLAFGAIVALGTSLFAGAPAQAAAAITVAPTAGTGYTVLASDTFTVKVFGNTDFTFSTSTPLKWKVTKPSATATVAFENQGSGTPSATAQSTSTISYLTPSAVTATTAGNTLKLNPTIGSTGASSNYLVQPFIDLDGSDSLNSADLAGNEVTVKFVKGADITSVVTLDQVSAGLAATGTVKYSNTDFNYSQSTLANTKVLINKNGGTFSAAQSVTLSDAEDSFEYSIADGTAAVTVGAVIGVKSQVAGYDSDSTYTNSTVVYSTADSASDATGQKTTVTVGDDIALSSGDDYLVRTGTKAFTYRVDFNKASTVQAVAAGKPVRITVTESGSSSDTLVTNDVIRVNGKKLSGSAATSQSAVLNTVTDATGGITVSVESELGLVGDKISIAVLATGSGSSITSTKTFAWTDAAISTFTESAAPLGSTTRTIVKGSAVTIKYAIRDQFGKLWTKSGSSYQLRATGSDGTLVLTGIADFSNGEATLTYTDNSTSADADTKVTAEVHVKTTGNFSQETGFTTDTVESIFNIVTTAQAATKITRSIAYTGSGYATDVASSADGVASATADRSDKTLKALDLRSNNNGASLAITSGKGVKIAGTVYNADGSAAAGVPVTVTSTGAFFSTNATGSSYVSANSIILNSAANGTYEVYVHSNKGGKFTVSIAAGSATATQAIKFAAAAATDGSAISVTAPSNVLPGRAVDVSVLLTDKLGAPVTTSGSSDIDVTVTGVGYATTIADDTDADGLIAFKVIYGADEVGTTTIKVTYDADGDGTTYLPVTVTKVIESSKSLPSTTTARVAGSTKRFFVSVDNNTGAKNVIVKVAGKTFRTLKGSATAKSYAVAAPKGKHKVTVFVGGKLIATKTITVK